VTSATEFIRISTIFNETGVFSNAIGWLESKVPCQPKHYR